MNIYKKRIFGLIWAFLYVGIYLGISVIIQNVYIVWLAASGLSQNEILEKTLGATFALSVISSMISVWAYILIGKVRKKPINTVIKNKPVTAATVGMSALCAVGARMIVSAYLYLAQGIEPLKKSIDDAAEFSPALESAGQLFAAATAMFIIAPLFEEILFRCLVMGEFSSFMRPWASVILQAAVFGVCHAVLFQSIFASLVGILIGIIYFKTQSLKTAAVCHGIFNLSAAFTFLSHSGAGAAVCAVFGIMLVGISMFYIMHEK